MKKVILSADNDSVVYLVPDTVAENLEEYCIKFSDWLYAKKPSKYRTKGGMCFTQEAFIEYLNHVAFPYEESKEIENIGWTDFGEDLPPKYNGLPYFNF